MNPSQPSLPSPRNIVHLLAVHWRRCLAPAVLLGIAAAVYAVVSQPTWQASQALIIRNEAANNDTRPGKFSGTDEMKTVQETILELVKGHAVLFAALAEVGPPADAAQRAAWPTDRDVQQLRDAVTLVPPKGAEFGATEVFYLNVRDNDRSRAVALSRAIVAQLQTQFQQLRDLKAQSMIDELNKTVALAKNDLNGSLARLSKTEAGVGSDLAELRVLNNDANSGDGALGRTVTEIKNELRQARAAEQAAEQLLGVLQAAADDPGRLLATSNRLLESQPALRRLKDGLLDAQLHTAGLQGHLSELHPLVLASKQAEEEIGRHLHDELAIARRGVEGDLQFTAERVATLQAQLAKANDRLSRLAEVRAVYSSQVAETNNRMRLLERAEQNLAEAYAAHAGAKAASLISCIDAPDAGIRPVSPSRAMIILIGIAGGLLVGFGITLLTAPSPNPESISQGAADTATACPAPLAHRSAPVVSTISPIFPPSAGPGNGKSSLTKALQKAACPSSRPTMTPLSRGWEKGRG